jgi:hypothetical protein
MPQNRKKLALANRGVMKMHESAAPEQEIRKLAKRLDKIMHELKYFSLADDSYGSISYNGTDFVQPITNVPQGDGDSTRDGDQLTIHTIEFRLSIKISTTTPTFLRVIMFQWKPNTTPVYASVLFDKHNTSNAPMSMYQHDTRQMFVILYDTLIELDTVAHPAHCIHHLQSKGFIPKIQYTSGSTTVATNMVYVLAVSDVLAAGPQVIFYSKVTYYDG